MKQALGLQMLSAPRLSAGPLFSRASPLQLPCSLLCKPSWAPRVLGGSCLGDMLHIAYSSCTSSKYPACGDHFSRDPRGCQGALPAGLQLVSHRLRV